MRTPLAAVMLITSSAVLFCPGCDDDPTVELQQTFENYMAAKQAGNGEAVLNLIDPKNVEHQDEVISAARTATRLQIDRMEPLQRLEIAYLRGALKPEELKSLDGRKLVILETQKKIDTEDEDAPQITLGNVKCRMPRATAELLVDDEGTDIRIEFVKVEGKWLINDECFDQLFNKRSAKIAEALHMREDTFLLRLASARAGSTITASVWDSPPK